MVEDILARTAGGEVWLAATSGDGFAEKRDPARPATPPPNLLCSEQECCDGGVTLDGPPSQCEGGLSFTIFETFAIFLSRKPY